MTRRMTAMGDRSLASIGERLRVSREALGYNQADFCRKAQISKTAYNAYEKAKERPSIDNAFRIKDAHKLTLEWIYDGDNSGLRASLADAIKSIRQARTRA
jgi:transcriptional regulator with XRE-family HTH domain